ncbi:MAG: hypothetical protein HQ559_12030, partial [Lentisphaerae bacterium]|nr:hypothetical protein [Lentisphaerota bacterium]
PEDEEAALEDLATDGDLFAEDLPVEEDAAEALEELPFEEFAEEEALGEEEALFPLDEDVVETVPDVLEAPVEPVPDVVPAPVVIPAAPVVVEPVVVEPVPVVGMPEETELPRKIRDIMAEQQLLRKALEHHGKDLLARGEEALAEGNYLDAVKLFQEARKNLKRAELVDERRRVQEGLGSAYYGQSQIYRRREELEEALKMADTAAEFRHPRAQGLSEEIRKQIVKGPSEVVVEKGDRWKGADVVRFERDVARLLKEGKQHYALKEYVEAQKKFEAVLAMDPFNSEAIRLRHKTGMRRYDSASVEGESTRRDMMAEVRETWNRRDYAEIKRDMSARGTGPIKTEEDESRRIRVLRKMAAIQIPNIEFRQANIFNVVDELQTLSVDFDPTEDPADKGVNIILNMQAGREGEEGDPGYGSPVDPFAEAGAADQVPPITFSARYISLLDTLKIVCDLAGLKFRVEGRVVMVVRLNAPGSKIIVRMFPVLPSVEEKIPTIEADFGGGGGGGFGGGFDELERRGPANEGQDWKKFFGEMGVEWPDGSSIKYVRTIGRIVVANTEENLSVFEDVLSLLNVVPNQIEIEARFVEINQADAASLGLEWYLRDDWELLQAPVAPGTPLSSTPRISALKDRNVTAGSGGGFTKANRFMSQLGASEGLINDSVLSIAGILTNPGLSMVLHTLQQKGFADLLSAPKVTTQAGSSALIKVVTEYIYPTDFAVTPVTGVDAAGNSVVVGGVVEPSGFEMREVGVILEVSPDVSQENQMITLNMTPRVVSEPTWFNYGSQYTAPDGSIQQLNMQQPFFHTRSVETSISIYNGATVVMGGMITESREDVDDKIPLMGDIPVLGRLFRSKYDQSSKRNLLIFVTARLVDPAGQPIQEMEGLADRYKDARSDGPSE